MDYDYFSQGLGTWFPDPVENLKHYELPRTAPAQPGTASFLQK
jgi:hypothetical protein